MEQFLPRGYKVSKDKRIKKLIGSGVGWQLYETNIETYVLASDKDLYEKWIKDYALPEGTFQKKAGEEYYYNCSSSDYIISSMEYGPYPCNYGQVEAFSIAFNTAMQLFPDMDIHDGIYIEEFSLLLPTSFETNSIDNGIVYAKWLTGGVNVSIDSFDRVCHIMSWLSKDALRQSAETAGFAIAEEASKEKEDSNLVKESGHPVSVPHTKAIKDGFTLIGRPELEQFFNDNIIDIVTKQEEYKRMGISFPGATILYGAPGCGKTYAIDRLSEYLGWKRFDIDSSTIASSYIHDTSKKISEVFKAAEEATPSIIVIDEMEAFLTDRAITGPSGSHHVEEVAEFLRRIPEAISKGVLVFAMTNMIESIDPAILRRGRFDHIIEVKMPSAEEIEVLLKAKFMELPVDDSVDPKSISLQLEGHPMSDISFVLREAGRFAVKNGLDYIDRTCMQNAINLLPKKKEKPKIGFASN